MPPSELWPLPSARGRMPFRGKPEIKGRHRLNSTSDDPQTADPNLLEYVPLAPGFDRAVPPVVTELFLAVRHGQPPRFLDGLR